MKERLRRLLHGQVCPVCQTTRRVRWFLDTGACSQTCVTLGLLTLTTTSQDVYKRVMAALDER